MEHKIKSALNVMEGVEQPAQINTELVKRLHSKKSKTLTPGEYLDGIFGGNRTLLSKAITLIESALPKDQEMARQIVDGCLKAGPGSVENKVQSSNVKIKNQSVNQSISQSANPLPKSIRIGITGVPGVGKSTFIEALGTYLTRQGHKLAVLAIDPSSTRSKGSILGDKTRMEALATDPNAFIRPSPSAGSLGGVARKTRETIILCEAAGFDIIFVETVGVGQSETTVHSMVDFFLLLMLAGAGDELQGIKRGIIEMADVILINKADGDNLNKAKAARVEYANALHLFPPASSGWQPVVDICSAQSLFGIDHVWEIIMDYYAITTENGFFHRRRMEQNKQIMLETIEAGLHQHFFSRKDISAKLHRIDQEIRNGLLNPYSAAQEMLEQYFRKE
ncbi:MAG TPA: methylmalonyl Co-A mutase-associated GTPase MeaB [Bacteroidales bacterium]|nr:methylmalonyl Co-A mutase-associated GTPase MeaB [Bacteroidales bacterium]HPS51876.1 methylmalonyl Co-A mutase-associated GTPase MeaB [Bacteroidales bacterium]